MALETVVFPVAGRCTRLAPATTRVPDVLSPVHDTPLIQFAIDEALQAGARRLVFVTHPGASALAAHIRTALKAQGAEIAVDLVEQPEPRGLGHAVLQAELAVSGDRFGVILPFDLVLGARCLRDLAAAHARLDCRGVVGALDVPQSETGKHTIFALDSSGPGPRPVRALAEKPAPEDAPSRLAAVGRYVLSIEIFGHLRGGAPGADGDIRLTDAIDRMGDIHAMPIDPPRYDCSSAEGLFAASEAIRAARLAAKDLAAGAATPRARAPQAAEPDEGAGPRRLAG